MCDVNRNTFSRFMRRLDQWLPILSICLLVVLHLYPLFRFPLVPTQDGPAHLENAWIIRQIWLDPENPLGSYYEINPALPPNWFCHAFMVAAMSVVPPLLAEKLFVAFYAMLFIGAMAYLLLASGRDRLVFLPLVGPFIYGYVFHMGFYNFSISLPLALLIIGYDMRRKGEMNIKHALVINGLFAILYSAHMLTYLVALFYVSLGALFQYRRQIFKLASLGLLPAYLLPAQYFLFSAAGGSGNYWGIGRLYRYLARSGSFTSYNPAQDQVGVLFFRFVIILFSLTIIARLWEAFRKKKWRFRPEDTFLLMSIVTLIAYFSLPGRLAGGGYVSERLMLYPILFLIPWLFCPWRAVRPVVVCGASLFFVLYFNLNMQSYRKVVPPLQEFRGGAKRMTAGALYLPLLDMGIRPVRDTVRILPFMHAHSYHTLDAGVINLMNYEARTDYFPLRHVANTIPHEHMEGLRHPPHRDVRFYDYPEPITYVSYQRHGPNEPVLGYLNQHYELIATNRYVFFYGRQTNENTHSSVGWHPPSRKPSRQHLVD